MNGSHERDQSVERLLRQSFASPRDGVTAACLDAETIAAWLDGGLTGSPLEIAQSHVADCARCQAIVGTLSRTNIIVPAEEPASRLWLGWLLPIAAAATAVVLWVAVPRVTKGPEQQAANTQAPVFEPQAPAPKPDDQLGASAPAAAPLKAEARAKEEQSADKSDLTRNDQPKVGQLSKDSAQLETDRLRDERQSVGGVASSPPVDQASASPAAAAPPAASAAAAPAAPSVARQTFDDRSANAVAEKIAAAVIVSPDPSIRWRLIGSAIERSISGGSQWQTVFTGGTSTLTAGAAPTASICWVIGRAGIVLRSIDGRAFSPVVFPDKSDLLAVQATDAQTASVSTVDGRIFDTTNGGVSWQRR